LQKKIPKDDLLACLNAARLAPSSRNRQPLEYILVVKNLDLVFNHVSIAGYNSAVGPSDDERPVTYIVIISNKDINDHPGYDVGLAVENIVLTALERGIGSCIMGSVEREELKPKLKIPENYNIELAIGLGYPKQKSQEAKYEGDIKYYLNEDGVLNVPKRSLKDIMHEEVF